MKLKLLNEIPQGLFDCKASELHKLLGGPTLIDIKGESDQTIFMTSLLHGNETSSCEVVKNVLKPYRNSKPPKNIIVFFGNTVAAEKELRHLPDQPDFNRIWEPGPLEENQLAMDVLDYAKTKKMFASLDIHNNTGKNPNYGCINYLDEEFLKMASHFADTTVFFTEPHNANSIAFGRLCPAMTIEAGLSGSVEGRGPPWVAWPLPTHLHLFVTVAIRGIVVDGIFCYVVFISFPHIPSLFCLLLFNPPFSSLEPLRI